MFSPRSEKFKLKSSGYGDNAPEAGKFQSQLKEILVEAEVHCSQEGVHEVDGEIPLREKLWDGVAEVETEEAATPEDLITVGETFPLTHDLLPTNFSRAVCLLGVPSVPLLDIEISIEQVGVTRALVDSGAQRSLISEQLIKNIPVNQSRKYNITALGDEDGIMSIGSVDMVVNLAGFAMMTKFVVVPKSMKLNGSNVVLGKDFLKVHGWEVRMKDRRMTKHYPNGTNCDLYFHSDGSCKIAFRHVKCMLTTPITVGPHQQEYLPLSLDVPDELLDVFQKEKGLFYFDCDSDSGVLTALPGLVESENLSVVVCNNENKIKSFKSNCIVGELSTVIELPSSTDNSKLTPSEVKDRIDIGHLNSAMQHDICELVSSCSGVLSAGDSDIGLAAVTVHEINLYNDTPIYQRPRRFPEPIAREIEEQCRELHSLDIIEPSNSSWSSPVVPIRKKDGTLRLCIDYRQLNKVTKPDRYPLPNLVDSVYSLKGNQYFTSLDLVRGYYQMPIHENSRECTAFSTAHAHWQFKRLSFGLKNAPSSFQREMQAVLREFPWSKVVIYIDDILIMEETYEKHMQLLGKVLQTLENHGMKIKAEKCEWVKTSVEFLGHIISQTGLKKSPAFVNKVQNFPLPVTVGQLQEFLGLINFQRKFVPGCSTMQKCLSALTGGKRRTRIEWTEERRLAFQALKDAIQHDVELAYPDYTSEAAKLELSVDASALGAGACLAQKQNGNLVPIAFASMSFNLAQRRYSTLERELAALRWGVKCFRAFLYGIEFVVKTDHQPLVYLHNMRLVDARLARTLEDLSDFNFTIEYVPGELNVVADGLSRIPLEGPEELLVEGGLPPGLMVDGIPAPGGGDSLFISLMIAMEKNNNIVLPSSHEELRRVLVEEILLHPAKYGYTKVNKNIRQSLRLMKFKGQLPCLEVLWAFSSLYTVAVLVYFWSDQPVIYRHPSVSEEGCIGVIHLQCLAGVHFNPLRATVEFVAPSQLWKDPPSQHKERKVEICHVEEDLFDKNCHKCRDSDHARILIKLNNKKYCAIIDTGAEISLVQKSVFDELEESLNLQVSTDQNVEIEGFTGRISIMEGVTDLKLDLLSDIQVNEHSFAIVGDELIPHCFILGVDFLVANSLALDMYSDVLRQYSGFVSEARLMVNTDKILIAPVFMVQGNVNNDDIELVGDLGLPFICGNNPTWITSIQEDTVIVQLKEVVSSSMEVSVWPNTLHEFRGVADLLTVRNNILLYMLDPPVCVVPFCSLVSLASATHECMGHIGREKLSNILKRNVWHPRINKICEDICVTCPQCQRYKIAAQRVSPPVLKIEAKHPFDLVAVDIIQFPRTSQGNVACLVVVDHYSKWLNVVPIRNKTASTVTSVLQHRVFPVLPRIPDRLLTDNGPEFSCALFDQMTDSLNIKHVLTTPYHPSSNGCVERMNRTVAELLRNMSESPTSWDKEVGKAVMIYNNTRHASLGMSPAEFLLTKSHTVIDAPIVPRAEFSYWKPGHSKFVPFSVGDLVRKKVVFQDRSVVNKFKPRFDGPYEVVTVNDNGVSYRIRRVSDGSELPAHHSQLIIWRRPPEYLNIDETVILSDHGVDDHAFTDGGPECDESICSNSLFTSDNSVSSSVDSLWSDSCSSSFSGFAAQPMDRLGSRSTSGPQQRDDLSNVQVDFDTVTNVCNYRDSSSSVNFTHRSKCDSDAFGELDLSGISFPELDEMWEQPIVQERPNSGLTNVREDKDILLHTVGNMIQDMAYRMLDRIFDKLVDVVNNRSDVQNESFSGFVSKVLSGVKVDDSSSSCSKGTTNGDTSVISSHPKKSTNSCDSSNTLQKSSFECVHCPLIREVVRPHTRSRGGVPDQPHVQSYPLEYEK